MNRYLGAKTKILPDIYQAFLDQGIKDGTVCDIFSGSLAVSLFLKRKGYKLISNDINFLSYAYGKAYIENSHFPKFDISKLLKRVSRSCSESLEIRKKELLLSQEKSFDRYYKGRIKWSAEYTKDAEDLYRLLAALETATYPLMSTVKLRNDVETFYTKSGKRSAYKSVRGSVGKRNYFTLNNARRIDFILSHIRFWWQNGLINETTKYVLVSILLDSMERCVNIQGTYHDFLRNGFEQRAKSEFRFVVPEFYGFEGNMKGHRVACENALTFIKKAPKHNILYVDPPYNFRQYTAYYHLPNLMAKYSDIEDLDKYFSKLAFVRGQNMDDDFTSTFSNRDEFMPSLKMLIETAKTDYVILSYFNGANHWNKFLENDNSVGFKLMRDLFFDKRLFESKSVEIRPIKRLNYQSQNGYKSKQIDEFLFIGKKTNVLLRKQNREKNFVTI